MGLPFPIIDALLLGFVYAKASTSMQGRIAVSLGFVYAKAPTSMQGRIAVSLIVPVLGFRGTIAVFLAALALSTVIVLCSARIRRIPRVPVLGFRGTIAVFLAALALSTVIVLCSARIRRIPRADGWDTAEL